MKRVIFISGKQGSGKTTASKLLCQFAIQKDLIPKVLKFADTIYEIHKAALPILHEHGIRSREMLKDGELLQVLGTEYGRNRLGTDVWAKACRLRVDKWLALSPDNIAIIDDARFENEFDLFPDAFKVRLLSPEGLRRERCSYWREDTKHASEIGLDRYEERGVFDLKWSTEFVRPDVSAKGIWECFLKA